MNDKHEHRESVGFEVGIRAKNGIIEVLNKGDRTDGK